MINLTIEPNWENIDGTDISLITVLKQDGELNQPSLPPNKVFLKCKEGEPCQLLVTAKQGYTLNSIDVLSTGRLMELYSETKEYMCTEAGSFIGAVYHDDLEIRLYLIQKSFDRPMPNFSFRLLSLQDKRRACIQLLQFSCVPINETVQPRTVSSTSINMERVREILAEVQHPITPEAERLMTTIETFQRASTSGLFQSPAECKASDTTKETPNSRNDSTQKFLCQNDAVKSNPKLTSTVSGTTEKQVIELAATEECITGQIAVEHQTTENQIVDQILAKERATQEVISDKLSNTQQTSTRTDSAASQDTLKSTTPKSNSTHSSYSPSLLGTTGTGAGPATTVPLPSPSYSPVSDRKKINNVGRFTTSPFSTYHMSGSTATSPYTSSSGMGSGAHTNTAIDPIDGSRHHPARYHVTSGHYPARYTPTPLHSTNPGLEVEQHLNRYNRRIGGDTTASPSTDETFNRMYMSPTHRTDYPYYRSLSPTMQYIAPAPVSVLEFTQALTSETAALERRLTDAMNSNMEALEQRLTTKIDRAISHLQQHVEEKMKTKLDEIATRVIKALQPKRQEISIDNILLD